MGWKTKFGRCIYVSPSGYKVQQNFFYRWLTMGSDALQTAINRRNPHKPVLYYLPALTHMVRQFPAACCLLGLGGAGVPLMLARHTPLLPLDVVDNSEEIIAIAQKYFLPDAVDHLNLIHDNAFAYLNNCTAKYVHLIVDLYGPNHFPHECANEQFFIACAEVLTPDGFLSVNLANVKEQWPIFQLIRQQFKHTLVIPIKQSANMVIIAANHLSKSDFLELVKMKRVMWVESWGYVGELRK